MRAVDRMRKAQADVIKRSVKNPYLMVSGREDKRTVNACISRGWLADISDTFDGRYYAVTNTGVRFLCDHMLDNATNVGAFVEIYEVLGRYIKQYAALDTYLENYNGLNQDV